MSYARYYVGKQTFENTGLGEIVKSPLGDLDMKVVEKTADYKSDEKSYLLILKEVEK